jgi:FlaA1/EpsC-like NDP-sugar epimerase
MLLHQNAKKKIIGIRPGEKIHEEMISISDSFNTIDIGKYYVVIPVNDELKIQEFLIKKFNGIKVKYGFNYNSGSNSDKETIESLRNKINLFEKKL